MEIRCYCCYILISCAMFFPSYLCKSISLNDLIAAEERRASLQTPHLETSETKTNTRDLPKTYTTYAVTKHITSGSIAETNQKISPLKYRKTFQIRTPLRPKKIKYSYKPRSKRLNAATKREIDNNEVFNKNYIPILKSLSILFNSILSADSGEDHEVSKEYNIKQRAITKSEECPCARKSKYKQTYSEPPEAATAIISAISSTIPSKVKTINLTETSPTSTNNTFNDNISAFRRNKNVPVLSPRDPISSWRNHNGFGEGSLSTYNRNFEGHISGNNGNDENNNSGRKTTESYTESYQQYTDDGSGDDASSNGFFPEIGRNRHVTSKSATEAPTVETSVGSNETLRNDRGDSNESKRFDKFETRRNQTESRILLSQSSSRLRRFKSQEETTEILWQIENPKENVFDVTYNITRNQRFSNRNDSVAPEDQEIRRADQKLTLDDFTAMLINATNSNLTHEKDKQKIVVIYDGYSIARDVNGENKLTEKAYRIHS